MTDEPDNLVLQLLRRMDQKLDRMVDDMHDLKVRVTSVEEVMATNNRRLDRLEQRFERVERRLDLADQPAGQ